MSEYGQLRDRTLEALADIVEFEAFTVLGYDLGAKQVATLPKDYTFTLPFAQRGPTGRLADRLVKPADVGDIFRRCSADLLHSLVFQQQVALFEHFLFDALRLLLIAEPKRLPRAKKIEYSVVVGAATTEDLLRELVDRELNELRYKTVAEWFEYYDTLVNGVSPTADEVHGLAEAKATRDLLVHNKGIVNRVYLRKAGIKARAAEGAQIPLDNKYSTAIWDLIAVVVAHIGDVLDAKVGGRAP